MSCFYTEKIISPVEEEREHLILQFRDAASQLRRGREEVTLYIGEIELEIDFINNKINMKEL